MSTVAETLRGAKHFRFSLHGAQLHIKNPDKATGNVVVPGLGATNTFTGANTFTGVNTLSGANVITASTLSVTGASTFTGDVEMDGALNHDGGTVGFFNATPAVQQPAAALEAGFTVNAGTGVNVDSVFTGNVGSSAYTVGDIVKALKTLGLIESSPS